MANDELMRLADMAKSLWESTGNDEASYLERELRTLAQRAPQNGAVPDGYMLVRESMLRYWLRVLNGVREGNINWQADASHLHRSIAALLAAAPAPEAETHADCCDTPAYCSSVRRCTAKDAAPEAELAKGDVYEAYKTWPDDIRAKLSFHDLRRMSGWAPRTHVGDWRIDTSAGRPILVYQNCSVIEAETATYVLGLIARDAPPAAGQPEGMKALESLAIQADAASKSHDERHMAITLGSIAEGLLRLASAQRAGKDGA